MRWPATSRRSGALPTPELAIAARRAGSATALRRILRDLTDGPAFDRTTALLLDAATRAPAAGRPMYATLLSTPLPDDVVERFFHAASLLREHRGDGHIAALMVDEIGGLEAHALAALAMGLPPEKFGRLHHLPPAQTTAVVEGLRSRGLIGKDGWLTEEGQTVKQRIEKRTDDLAAVAYGNLGAGELEELVEGLRPLAGQLLAAQDA